MLGGDSSLQPGHASSYVLKGDDIRQDGAIRYPPDEVAVFEPLCDLEPPSPRTEVTRPYDDGGTDLGRLDRISQMITSHQESPRASLYRYRGPRSDGKLDGRYGRSFFQTDGGQGGTSICPALKPTRLVTLDVLHNAGTPWQFHLSSCQPCLPLCSLPKPKQRLKTLTCMTSGGVTVGFADDRFGCRRPLTYVDLK